MYNGFYLKIAKELQELQTLRLMNIIKTTMIPKKNPKEDRSSFNKPHQHPPETNRS
jgi:hypothetical protein